MPRGNPVNGVVVVRYRDRVSGQIVPESYRPRTGGPRGIAERLEALQELLGAADEGLPEPLPRLTVEGGEDLAAAGGRGEDESGSIAPIYLRPPDAERWRERDSLQAAE